MHPHAWLVGSLTIAAVASCAAPTAGEQAQLPSSEPGLAAPGMSAPTDPAPPSNEPAPPVPGLSPAMQDVLNAHNQARAQHCAAPLRWSTTVAAHAQAWADDLVRTGCRFEHSLGHDRGENLAAGTIGHVEGARMVSLWTDEVALYDFARGTFDASTGHFTQVVWKATQELGCGRAECNGSAIWVCQYTPPGNVWGEFQANVRPRGCTP